MHQANRHSLAIIGVGPKGLFCLERLIAHLALAELTRPVDVYLVHRDGSFGCSPVYAVDQPEYIILNVAVGEVDLWSASEPPIFSGRGPNFIEWYANRYPERPRLSGGEFLSRAIVGHYLQENFLRLTGTLPANVRLIQCRGEAIDLDPLDDQIRLDWRDSDGETHSILVQQVLLATGHSRLKPTLQERQWRDFSKRHDQTRFIPFVYPVRQRLGDIEPHQTVAVKGLGLTFIDAVLELTEGRGGRFERDDAGQLHYRPSRREPLIFPFSRTGLPMAPKAVDLPTKLRPLRFCTPEALARIRELHGGQISLDQGPWHLFQLEMTVYYYEWAMKGAFAERLADLDTDETALKTLIRAFHSAHPEVPVFDPKPLLDPVEPRHLRSGSAFNAFIDETMGREIERAIKGFAGDGLKSAVDIWFEVRYALSQAMAFGGLSPQSHRQLMEEINPVFKRVVFGPPLINLEKLHALLRAGILDFSCARAPEITTDEKEGKFRLRTRMGSVALADVLIDGRYPQIKLEQDASPLYQNLRQRGLVRSFENTDRIGSGVGYRPGAIDHTERYHHVIDAQGRAQASLCVIGIPTEGNLLGNFTIVADGFPNTWAGQAVERMVKGETKVTAS